MGFSRFLLASFLITALAGALASLGAHCRRGKVFRTAR